jgi:hypothetical protein
MQILRSLARRSTIIATLQQGRNSLPMSPKEEPLPICPPLASPHEEAIPNPLETCNDHVLHEPPLSQAVHGANQVYDGFMYGRESSMEEESSKSGEECEEDKFLGWPPELLTPQHRQGLHQKKKKLQAESSTRGQKVQQYREGRRWDCSSRISNAEAAAIGEGYETMSGTRPRREGARLGRKWAGTGQAEVGIRTQQPPDKGGGVGLGEPSPNDRNRVADWGDGRRERLEEGAGKGSGKEEMSRALGGTRWGLGPV